MNATNKTCSHDLYLSGVS